MKTIITIILAFVASAVFGQQRTFTLPTVQGELYHIIGIEHIEFDTTMVAKDTTYAVENNKPIRSVTYTTKLLKKPYLVTIQYLFDEKSWNFHDCVIRPVMDFPQLRIGIISTFQNPNFHNAY